MNESHSPQVTGPVGQAEGGQVHGVDGELVVEAEPVAAVADLDRTPVVLDPPGLRRDDARRDAGAPGR